MIRWDSLLSLPQRVWALQLLVENVDNSESS
jgi:hypothetical protein